MVSPDDLGACRMAHLVLRPTVINFLELMFADEQSDMQMEEFVVGEKSVLVGKLLMESGIRRDFNLIVISIKRTNGEMRFNPHAETRIQANDTIIVVGERRNLQQLEKIVHP